MGQVIKIKNTDSGKSFTYTNNGQSVDCFLLGNPTITEMSAEGEKMLAANTLLSMKSSGMKSSAGGKKMSGRKRSGKKRSNRKRSVRRG
jgi:hypothetical protein